MMRMMMSCVVALISLLLNLSLVPVKAEDPYLYFTWNITYGTISPLGVPQQGILINGQFPGPNINSTTNNNIVVNVFNNLDEPFLLQWRGIQQRKNSWQDGMPGTNCPILPGKNFTYKFQVKDQIGSYFYYPSIGLQRAAGAFGGLQVNSRMQIPVPFDTPAGDYFVLAGDWYSKNHTNLQRVLDSGRSIRQPNGMLINGKSGKGAGGDEPMFTMEAGKVYRYRICNVGLKNSLNFRIQGHSMKVVEMEGSHTVQNMYDSLDIHLGQCFSVLVTADQPPRDYYMLASARFTRYSLLATAIIRYANSQSPPSSVLPEAPTGLDWSLNQYLSFRWNLTASAARPNPQGSYHYGDIQITRTIKLVNSAASVEGKLRYAINGVSYTEPTTPPKLSEYFGIASKVFEYNAIEDVPPTTTTNTITIKPIIIQSIFRNFVEIILENPEKIIQSWHLNGYSFFAVAIRSGKWSPQMRKYYNVLDAISRHSIQVYPKSWAAILLTTDNCGMWNLRSENLERQYLGQQLYISVLSPARSLRDEYNIPLNALRCGMVEDLPLPPPYTL